MGGSLAPSAAGKEGKEAGGADSTSAPSKLPSIDDARLWGLFRCSAGDRYELLTPGSQLKDKVLLYVHGWQPGHNVAAFDPDSKNLREHPAITEGFLTPDREAYGERYDTAAPWREAGYDVVCFFWAPIADEATPKEAERKVWDEQETLRREIAERDERIAQLEEQVREQAWTSQVVDIMPHAGQVSRFLATLPDLAGPSSYGTEIIAPVWALRCMRGSGSCSFNGSSPTCGTMTTLPGADDLSPRAAAGKDKRSLLALFEMFEQLSSGTVTPMELTEARPLDVYVHQTEDNSWGLFCSSRHRQLAFLMRQACSRNELLMVRCVLRPKEDLSFWGWQWYNFYDGADGRTVEPKSSRTTIASRSCSPTSSSARLTGVRLMGGSGSSPRLAGGSGGGGSGPSTPRVGSLTTFAGVRSARFISAGAARSPSEPMTPTSVAAAAAAAAATALNGEDGQPHRSPKSVAKRGGFPGPGPPNPGTLSAAALMGRGRIAAAKAAVLAAPSAGRTKSAATTPSASVPSSPRRPARRSVPTVNVELDGGS